MATRAQMASTLPPAPVSNLYVEKLKMLVLRMWLPGSSLVKLLVESSGWLEK